MPKFVNGNDCAARVGNFVVKFGPPLEGHDENGVETLPTVCDFATEFLELFQSFVLGDDQSLCLDYEMDWSELLTSGEGPDEDLLEECDRCEEPDGRSF